jgi:tRNA pseudouridine32 synthase/23S rRNA pseudouridine746 synthase
MARPPRPPLIRSRDGVSASCVALPAGDWPTVLDFLAQRLPALSRSEWAERMAEGTVVDEQARALAVDAPYPRGNGQRLFYYRHVPHEPEPPHSEQIVFQDEHLVVADKPHFMPVTPGGRYVHSSLLVRLKRRLGIDTLSPLHRIDRETAGLVAFAAQPAHRDEYQALFRDRAVEKIYEAVAPYRDDLTLPRTHRSRLVEDADRFFVSHEAPGAPNSETQIELIARHGALAHYRLRPITGRRHQLRVHLAALGVPIAGDAFYPRVLRGPDEPDDLSQPLQLLARALAFDDPVTGQRRHFESQLRLQALAV